MGKVTPHIAGLPKRLNYLKIWLQIPSKKNCKQLKNSKQNQYPKIQLQNQEEKADIRRKVHFLLYIMAKRRIVQK